MSEDTFNEDLEDLYENAPCGYLSLGADGKVVKVNKTLTTLLGRSAEDIIDKRLRDLLSVPGSIFYETHFAPLLRMQGFFYEVALDMLKGDGTLLPVLANAAERRDEAGNVMFTRLAMFPAKERRRHERELAAGRDIERETAKLREQFIAVLGHDLRNPLAGLDGGRRVLAKMHDDPKSDRLLRLMGESIARMGSLIDNLMDLARGRLGGGIGLDRSQVARIEPVLAQVINEIKAGHPDRVIEMHLDVDRPLDVDQARIAQMFSNLLGNAIAHGAEDKPVTIDATIENEVFRLSVSNGGEPIPPAAMQRLFRPFYRGEVRQSQQGLGLGLYIANQIAEAHGGTLEVKSEASETRFTFSMPLA